MADRRDIVIVGAPRSGTNMLRDVLTSLPGVVTWPCDEVNLMWRHGNREHPDDELTAAHARPDVQRYLRGQFDRIRRRYDAGVVVEKTCATSLRVGFVRAVLPEARYVFITRDGIDAAASAMDRWHAPFDWRYTARKVRWVPPGDLPYYGARFVDNQLRRHRDRSRDEVPDAGASRTPDERVDSWWGPRPRDWRELMTTRPLDEVCALQWQRCVEASFRDLDGLPADQLVRVRYEDFVADPAGEAVRLADRLELAGTPEVGRISAASVGKGRTALGPDGVQRLSTLVGGTLRRVHDE